MTRDAAVRSTGEAVLLRMPLTAAERGELRDYVLERTCAEYRRGEACVQRNNSDMMGSLHAGCAKAEDMLDLVDKA